jgi:hypothetical protein
MNRVEILRAIVSSRPENVAARKYSTKVNLLLMYNPRGGVVAPGYSKAKRTGAGDLPEEAKKSPELVMMHEIYSSMHMLPVSLYPWTSLKAIKSFLRDRAPELREAAARRHTRPHPRPRPAQPSTAAGTGPKTGIGSGSGAGAAGGTAELEDAFGENREGQEEDEDENEDEDEANVLLDEQTMNLGEGNEGESLALQRAQSQTQSQSQSPGRDTGKAKGTSGSPGRGKDQVLPILARNQSQSQAQTTSEAASTEKRQKLDFKFFYNGHEIPNHDDLLVEVMQRYVTVRGVGRDSP